MKNNQSFLGKLRPVLSTSLFLLASFTNPEQVLAADTLPLIHAASAYDFIDTLGVDTHMGYTQKDKAYSNVPQIKSELKYLDFKYARDRVTNLSGTSPLPIFRDINNDLGIKYMFFVEGNMQEIATIKQNLSLVAEIEGANEIDNWPPTFNGKTGTEAARAAQQELWAEIKTDPNTKDLPVSNLTIASSRYKDKLGDLTPYADRANIHIYPQWAKESGSYAYTFLQNNYAATGLIKKPLVISETGWWTLPAINGVPEKVQAKFELDVVLDAFKQGAKRTMLYELTDETLDPSDTDREKHFGLFHYDGSPKPAADAFHNLTTLLQDDKPVPSPGLLSYAVRGLPSSAYQLLLQKSDGTFVLVLWNEGKFWDNVKHQELPVAPVNVTLQLEEAAAKVQVFDPLTGTTPSVDKAGVSSVPVAIPDHPVLVFIAPGRNTSSHL